MVTSGLQSGGPTAGRSPPGDGARLRPGGPHLHGRRGGRFPRHLGVRSLRLPRGCLRWGVRPPGRPPSQRAAELQ